MEFNLIARFMSYESTQAAELPIVLTHVIAILQVVEVAAKEVFLVVKPKLSQPVNTLALALLQ